jgi:hypothetical protein
MPSAFGILDIGGSRVGGSRVGELCVGGFGIGELLGGELQKRLARLKKETTSTPAVKLQGMTSLIDHITRRTRCKTKNIQVHFHSV